MELNSIVMAKKNDKRKAKGRATAPPLVPKAGFTKQRRRLEDGGKTTT